MTVTNHQENVQERIRRVEVMTRQGMSIPGIAAVLHVHPRSVVRYRSRAGIAQVPRARWTSEQKRQALRMLEDGYPYSEVGETLGMSPGRLGKVFPGFGMSKADSGRLAALARRMRGVL